MRSVLALFALCFCVVVIDGIDISSELDYDTEFEDEIDGIQMETNQEDLVDTLQDLNEDDVTTNDDVFDEKEMEREILKIFDEEDMRRRSLSTRLTNMLRKTRKEHGITNPTNTEGSCSAFRVQRKTKHHCTTEKTFLGDVTACKLTCRKGYKLTHPYPHYELCGSATKWRWTYELKGDKKAPEACVRGQAKTLKTKTCTSQSCMATAAYYMDKIDYKVNPCDDFYEYSCGRWLKETPIPPSSPGSFRTYSVLRNRVKRDMAKVLRKSIKSTDYSSIKKAKIVYKSCMNTKLIDRLKASPLLHLLRDELSWPIIDNDWMPSYYSLEDTLSTLRGRYHNNILFTVKVGKSDGKYILETWKGKTALPKKYYVLEKYASRLKAYTALLRDTAIMLGANPEIAHDDAQQVIDFETEIAFLKTIEKDGLTEKTITEMYNDIPGIDWLRLFQQMIWTSDITADSTVRVWNEAYLKAMIELLQRTEPRVVQNYMLWRFVKHRILNLDQRFQNRYLEFEKKLFGRKLLRARWFTCAGFLISAMQGPTGKMFIDKYFSPQKKKTAEDMFNNIRNGFITLLDKEVDWMDKKTKDYAKEKAKAIIPFIGYNKHIYENQTYLDGQWEQYVAKKYDYFGNVIRTLTQISQNAFDKLGKTYDQNEREGSDTRPTMVNAYYRPNSNTIILPAGEMQYPFYWGDEFPRMFQYGAIGTILGHEITHGFDNTGSMHDKYGNIKNWWTKSSFREFKKRTKCIEDQYSNYHWKAAGENLNGAKSLGENIADNGGIRESFEGYQAWLRKHNITGEDIEPATGLTNDQMFFVGFANVRCAKFTHRSAVHSVATMVHSPGRFRVIGSLQNFDKFSKAFHCKPKSYMNPEKKCIVW